MKEYGNVLLSGAEKEAVVGKIFDVTSVPSSFAEENSELLTKFLAVTAKMNAMYKEDRAPMLDSIAQAAGMDMEGTIAVLDVFAFPTIEEQLSDEWMGGWLAEKLKSDAEAMEEAGTITALDDYNGLINPTYLMAVSAM